MPRYAMVMDNRRCIGCHACTVACKAENHIPIGIWRTQIRYYEKGRFPYVRKYFYQWICDHCNEPPCVAASENNGVGAFYKRDGITLVDREKLTKGRTKAQIDTEIQAAIEACPLEAISVNPLTGLPELCTFCVHRVDKGLVPACVETCIGRARVFGDLSDPNSEVSRLVATNPTRTMMPADDGGGAGVYYIGLEARHRDYEAMEGGVQVDPNRYSQQ